MQMLFANLFKCNINAEVASCIQIFASVLLYHCRCCLQIFANWVSLQRLFANICEYSTISMQMLNANIHVATVYSYSMPGCSLTIERGGRGGRGGLSATWHLQQITEIIHLSFPPPSVLFFGVYKAVTKLLLFESTILRIISCWWLEKKRCNSLKSHNTLKWMPSVKVTVHDIYVGNLRRLPIKCYTAYECWYAVICTAAKRFFLSTFWTFWYLLPKP